MTTYSNKRRYPGPVPYTESDQNVFKGRHLELDNLYHLINNQALTVLYGKSGIGKTSIVEAGLVPIFNEDNNYQIINVRFHGYKGEESILPVQRFKNVLLGLREKNPEPTFLEKFKLEDTSVWRIFKELSINNQQKKSFLIIFDQFEELFSYNDKSILELQKALSSIINYEIPQEYWDKMNEAAEKDEEFLNDTERELIYSEILVRVLFIIKRNKLHLFNRFSTYFPNILKNAYNLTELTKEGAIDAIKLPAAEKGDFIVAPFEYEKSAIEFLLEHLEDPKSKKIDTAHLQILCYDIEDIVFKKQIKLVNKGEKVANKNILVKQKDLKDISDSIERFFIKKISEFKKPYRNPVKRLLENRLVNELGYRQPEFIDRALNYLESEHYLNIEEAKSIIQKLKDSHLIRESWTESQSYIELAHDKLLDPILKSRNEFRKTVEQKKIESDLNDVRIYNRQLKSYQRLAISCAIILAGFTVFLVYQNKKIQEQKSLISDEIVIQDEKLKLISKQSLQIFEQNVLDNIDDVKDSISELKYDGALEKALRIEEAAFLTKTELSKSDNRKLVNSLEAKEFSFTLFELGYFFAESLELEKAQNAILSYHRLKGSKPLDSSKVFSLNTRRSLRTYLNTLDHKSFEVFDSIYYPRMIEIPGGEFIAGMDSLLVKKLNNKGRSILIDTYEKPATKLNIDSFYIAETETTIAQYYLFTQTDSTVSFPFARFKEYFSERKPTKDLPMADVSWTDAVKYCNWLTKRNYNRRGLYIISKSNRVEIDPNWSNQFRLPTEAEWEYAAKEWPKSEATIFSGSDNYLEVGNLYDKSNDISTFFRKAYQFPKPVAQKRPNKFGLYDMTGNVWEWTNDLCSPRYSFEDSHNPRGRNQDIITYNDKRVIKGGAVRTTAGVYTNTIRLCIAQLDGKEAVFGFRVCQSVH
ncbi:MAG: SUMF1/EgtB/PvdO family nonheme iron enzyme [Bacteroidota bacterium]